MNTCATFLGRMPSAIWEPVALFGLPNTLAWVWFKPAAAPQSMLLKLSDELFANPLFYGQATLRNILFSLGLNPAGLHSWQINGALYEAMGGTSSLLDQFVPVPVPSVDPTITLFFNIPMMAPPAPMPMMPMPQQMQIPVASPENLPVQSSEANNQRLELPQAIAGHAGQYQEIFERIEADWIAIQQMERQLANSRKKFVTMISKLNTLNRELTTEEKLHAKRQQLSEWEDTKRWLRDNALKLSKHVKALDIGETSSAGKREWFHDIYETYIEPGRPFQGIVQAQRDFEMHRKMLKSLVSRISSAHSDAVSDGEKRATQVLSRITATVREESVKRRVKTEQFARAKSSYFH